MDVVGKLLTASRRSEVVEVLTELHQLAKREKGEGDGLVGRSYFRTISMAIDRLGQNLLGLLTQQEQHDYLVVIFTDAPDIDSFLVLAQSFSAAHRYINDKLLMCLVEFLKLRQGEMLGNLCSTTKNPTDGQLLASLCQTLVGLPDRMANYFKGVVPRLFSKENLARRLASDIIKALMVVHSRMADNQDCSVKFLSDLIGKLHSTGNGVVVWNCLIPFLVSKAVESFLWARIAQKLIVESPKSCLEAILCHIFDKADSSDSVYRLLGDMLLKSSTVDFVVTHKLLLVRYTGGDQFLLNLLGYVAKVEGGHQILLKTLKKLTDVWSDSSVLNHISQQQHLYISKAVVIAIRLVSERASMEEKSECEMRIVSGLNSHLQCVSNPVRTVGMVVGEISSRLLTSVKSTEELKPLRFEYEETDETRCLKRLAKGEPKSTSQTICEEFLSDFQQFLTFDDDLDDLKPPRSNVDVKKQRQLVEELDSDDDIEPEKDNLTVLDDDEFPITQKPLPPPCYIRDAMESLFEDKNVFKFEAAFYALESLIRAKAVGFDDVSVELVKILVHLEDRFALPTFEATRRSCLVSTCVGTPELTVPYLAQQFYTAEYSLGQRELILVVIRDAAKELSGGNAESKKKTAVVAELPPDSKEWQTAIVDQISQKTRRFHSTPTQSDQTVNKFASVAGLFFYPLLANCDRPTEKCFDLLGRDSFLLAHLIYTVAQVVSYARNSPAVNAMSSTLLELVWSLRFHEEPHVRQSLIFALLNVVSSVTPRFLVVEFGQQLTEAKFWLEIVENDDADGICQKLASQTLQMLNARMHEGLTSVVSVK